MPDPDPHQLYHHPDGDVADLYAACSQRRRVMADALTEQLNAARATIARLEAANAAMREGLEKIRDFPIGAYTSRYNAEVALARLGAFLLETA